MGNGKLVWDAPGTRLYETGIDRVVLYVQNQDGSYKDGVAWNGVSSINESPSGAEATDVYADNQKYLSLMSKEDFGATIEAYTTPDEWSACDGSSDLDGIVGVTVYQQARQGFGLCYRSLIGNDTVGESYGYKLHIVYNGKAQPSDRNYTTTNDSPEAATMSYELKTTPIDIPGAKPSALITIDATKFWDSENNKPNDKLQALEDYLYGTDSTAPKIPDPAKIIELLGSGRG